jgi:hypothetical protein
VSAGFHFLLWIALPVYIYLTIHYWAVWRGTR